MFCSKKKKKKYTRSVGTGIMITFCIIVLSLLAFFSWNSENNKQMQCSHAQTIENSRKTVKRGRICSTSLHFKWLEQFAFRIPKKEIEMLYNWAPNQIPGSQMNIEQIQRNRRDLTGICDWQQVRTLLWYRCMGLKIWSCYKTQHHCWIQKHLYNLHVYRKSADWSSFLVYKFRDVRFDRLETCAANFCIQCRLLLRHLVFADQTKLQVFCEYAQRPV